MGTQGLEAQLLREVVAEERGELEEAKERLLLSLAADTRQLQDLQDRILKLLKVTPSPTHTCVPILMSPRLDLFHHHCVTTPVSPHPYLTQMPCSMAGWLHLRIYAYAAEVRRHDRSMHQLECLVIEFIN